MTKSWHVYVDDGDGHRPATEIEVAEFARLAQAARFVLWTTALSLVFAQPPDIGADVPGGGAV
jgi:hypothetical protein